MSGVDAHLRMSLSSRRHVQALPVLGRRFPREHTVSHGSPAHVEVEGLRKTFQNSMPTAFAAIVSLAALGVGLYLIVSLIERRLLFWHESAINTQGAGR